MRIGLMVAGLILIVVGVAGWMGKLEYTHEKEVAKIGGLSATVNQDRTVPQWLGGLAALVGVGLIAGAVMRKG